MKEGRDPRVVANLVLRCADQLAIKLTNLALQKLLYICHAQHLIERSEPLVSGHFEAWQFGPVHPVVYESFKSAGKEPIAIQAKSYDPVSRVSADLPELGDPEIVQLVTRVVASFGKVSAGRLVEITHAKNGPWHHVVELAQASANVGLRIPNRLIVERYKFHKISVGAQSSVGEPDEDTPIAPARSG